MIQPSLLPNRSTRELADTFLALPASSPTRTRERDYARGKDTAPRRGAGLLAGWLAVWTSVCVAAAAQPARDFPLLAMAVRTDRSVYWLGEPVMARTRIVDYLTPALGVMTSFDLRGDTDLRIVQGEKIGNRYFGHRRPTIVTPRSYSARYGEALEFDLVLCYSEDDASGLAFPYPGKYRLMIEQPLRCTDRFNVRGRGGMPLSTQAESPTFQVVSPPPEAQGALDILMSEPQCFEDMNGGRASLISRVALERVAREYPKSRYAPYCLHALANLALLLAPSLEEEEKRAEEFLTRLSEDYADYPLCDKARLQLADFYYDTGRFNLAFDIVQRLIAESEDNMARFSENRMIAPLIGRQPNPFLRMNVFNWYLFGTTRLPHACYSKAFVGSPL